MEATGKNNYVEALKQQTEVRELVLEGLRQAKEGKTKDIDDVCDRLEKKYTDTVI